MVFLFILFILMLISTALVIAAGMLSSRLSKNERWTETYEESETLSPNGESYSIK